MKKPVKSNVRFVKENGRIVNIKNAIKNAWKVTKQVLKGDAWIKRKTKIYKRDPAINRQIIIRDTKTGRLISKKAVKIKQPVSFEFVSGGAVKDTQKKVKLTKADIKRKAELIGKKKKRLKGETKLRKFSQFFQRNFASAKIKKFYAYTKIQAKIEKEFKGQKDGVKREIEAHIRESLNDYLLENQKDFEKMDNKESKQLINDQINLWIDYNKRMV